MLLLLTLLSSWMARADDLEWHIRVIALTPAGRYCSGATVCGDPPAWVVERSFTEGSETPEEIWPGLGLGCRLGRLPNPEAMWKYLTDRQEAALLSETTFPDRADRSMSFRWQNFLELSTLGTKVPVGCGLTIHPSRVASRDFDLETDGIRTNVEPVRRRHMLVHDARQIERGSGTQMQLAVDPQTLDFVRSWPEHQRSAQLNSMLRAVPNVAEVRTWAWLASHD